MVQKKVPIKPHLLKPDTQLVNHIRPSSPQTHEKLKKIMKKPRPVKRPEDFPPFRKKRSQQQLHEEDGPVSTSSTPQKSSPNYMKSTSCFEARKERSTSPKTDQKSKKNSLSYAQKGSQTSSLKAVRTLTKTTSFKPLRPKKKCSSVMLCEDLDTQKATCSSTLKDSKFPEFLELSHGGTELEGTSVMKVCPYTYCSLNGHHHDPVLPLRCFLSARRRQLKTQKSFKVGCLSPVHTKPVEKKKEEVVRESVIFEAPEVDMETETITPLLEAEEEEEEESRDFFVEIYSKDRDCSDIDWEEGNGSVSSLDDGQTLKSKKIDDDNDDDVMEEKTWKTGLYSELQDLYDEESVSSGAWSEENGDSESESLYHQMEDRDFLNDDASESSSSSSTTEADEDNITSITEGIKDELKGLNLPFGDGNIKCSINIQREEASQDSKTVPEFADDSKDEDKKNHTTIIYNIIQFNILVFVNGEKTGHLEMNKGVTVQVPANKMETHEVNEEHGRSNEEEEDDANNLPASDEISKPNQTVFDAEIPFPSQESLSNEQLNANEPEEECNGGIEDDKHSESSGLEGEHDVEEINEDPSINLKGSAQKGNKLNQDFEDSKEFNPRGPNFLPEVPEPDAETVDLRHQMMDERKNSEEWMVDFALQQAVTTLKPERKKKVALLVEAFEKVMPIPKYETHNRHTSKAFTNGRPMQACS